MNLLPIRLSRRPLPAGFATHASALALAAGLALAVPVAQAQSVPVGVDLAPAALRLAAERAVAGNPELAARLKAYRAAEQGVSFARAGRGPRVDLTADLGQQRSTFQDADSKSVDRAGIGLELRQVLWDGAGARHEVRRTEHERLARWFEMVDATEQTALEAVRAVIDVRRFRRLVALAEENVVQHRQALARIETRVKSGVGRGVDLEQAVARVALADSNLLTERANLHDVGARHLRVVGEAPAKGTEEIGLMSGGLPADARGALNAAVGSHPAISAAVESLRAARASVKTREAATAPRLEFRARAGGGHNLSYAQRLRAEGAVEITMNWPLYDGGAANARVGEQVALLGQAGDLRDKTCRDVAQTAAIAHNDVVRLAQQLRHLRLNTEAIERARLAYRQQFEIGQRSLLDLLNAENEGYTAQRALAMTEFDHALALVRSHAALGQLAVRLGLRPLELESPASDWRQGDDRPERCPVQPLSDEALQ